MHASNAKCWSITGSPYPCPPSNYTITLNVTLTFVASWFGHASHVQWLNKIPKFAFVTSLLVLLDPNNNSNPSLELELGLGLGLGPGSPSRSNQPWFYNPL